jgi:hypothetical protein
MIAWISDFCHSVVVGFFGGTLRATRESVKHWWYSHYK